MMLIQINLHIVSSMMNATISCWRKLDDLVDAVAEHPGLWDGVVCLSWTEEQLQTVFPFLTILLLLFTINHDDSKCIALLELEGKNSL